MESLKVPLTVLGERLEGESQKIVREFKGGSSEVLLPGISSRHFTEIKKASLDELRNLELDEILSFVHRLKKLWGSREYPLREQWVEFASKVTGYSHEMMELAAEQMLGIMDKTVLENALSAQFWDPGVLDGWKEMKGVLMHAEPRGRVLHVVGGNIPLVSVNSLISGIVTKNVNTLLIPEGDPVTGALLVASFQDVDPEHPITLSTSAVYWPRDNSRLTKKAIAAHNLAVCWAGKRTISTVRRLSPPEAEVIAFGPRRGVHLISKKVKSKLEEYAERAALDIVLFDQEACFSPQVSFVEKEIIEDYAEALAKVLEKKSREYPKGLAPVSSHALVVNTRMMHAFKGHRVMHPGRTDWTIILAEEYEEAKYHPLNRTIFIYPVDDVKEVVKYVGEETQSVGIAPFSESIPLRDVLSKKGVSRITHVGRMGYFNLAAPHDGRFFFRELVRFTEST